MRFRQALSGLLREKRIKPFPPSGRVGREGPPPYFTIPILPDPLYGQGKLRSQIDKLVTMMDRILSAKWVLFTVIVLAVAYLVTHFGLLSF